mgnify:FL=1
MPLLRQDDAVRLAALLVMLFLFTAVGFVGYVMAVTKPPQHNKSKNTSELFFPGPGWPSSQAAACRAALQGCKSPPRLVTNRLGDGEVLIVSRIDFKVKGLWTTEVAYVTGTPMSGLPGGWLEV